MDGEKAQECEDRHQSRGVITFNLPGYKIVIEKKSPTPTLLGGRGTKSPDDELGQSSSLSLGALGRRLSQRIKGSDNGSPILPRSSPEPGRNPYKRTGIDQEEQQGAQEHADKILAQQIRAREQRKAEKRTRRKTIEAVERKSKLTSPHMEVGRREAKRVARDGDGAEAERTRKERREAAQSQELRNAVRKYTDEKRRKDEEERRGRELERIKKEDEREAGGSPEPQRRGRDIAAPRQVQRLVSGHRFARASITIAATPAVMNRQQRRLSGNYIEGTMPKDRVPPAPLTEGNLRKRQEEFVEHAAPSVMNRRIGDMTRTIIEGYVSPDDIRRRKEEERNPRRR